MITEKKRSSFGRIIGISCIITLLAGVCWWWHGYTTPRIISASGGLYFPRETVIEVPQFFQYDPRWAEDPLGPSTDTLGSAGCAVASAAMVLASYGADLDPGRLNKFVHESGGYTPEGWLYWEAAAAYPPIVADHVYEDLPSYQLIDSNLLTGNPVIVRLRYKSGITHFVAIVGKRGFDYLVRDPGRGGERGIYPLKEFPSPIEALRFYKKRTPAPLPLETLQNQPDSLQSREGKSEIWIAVKPQTWNLSSNCFDS